MRNDQNNYKATWKLLMSIWWQLLKSITPFCCHIITVVKRKQWVMCIQICYN